MSELNYTYVTPDDGTTMFRAASTFQTDVMFASSGSKTKQIRTNNSPCYACVPIFLKKFKPSTFSSFTIYVSRILSVGNVSASIECMAKLVKNKIKVASMDWEKFANSLTKVCQQEVMNTLNNNANFKEAQEVLDKQIQQINDLSKKDVSQFCK